MPSESSLPAPPASDAVVGATTSPALIAAALAQLTEGVIVTDRGGRIQFVNVAAAHLHGVDQLDVGVEEYSRTYHLFTEDGRPYPSAELPLARAVLLGETVVGARWRIRRPDGSEILALGSARPVLGPDGERLGAVLTLRDDTAREDAERAERRSARILEQVSDAHVTMDREWRLLSVNPAAERALGVSKEVLLGRTHQDAFPASVGSEIERQYRRVLTEDVEAHFATHYVGEGNDVHIELDAYPTDEGGVAVFWRDVSARVRADEALEARNAQLQDQGLELELANQQLQDNAAELEMQAEERRATAAQLEARSEEADAARRAAEAERARTEDILEAMADAHFVLDAEFRFVAANGAMERGGGLPRETLLGRTIWELFPGTVGTAFERCYREVATDGVEAHFIHDYSDGRLELVVDVDAYPAADGGVAVFWRDVSARERAAAARAASERQWRTIADAIPTLAWTAGADGYIDWYNARWYEYTGTTPEQMEGWGWQAVHDPTVLPGVLERWQASIATGRPFEMTFPLRGADGRFRPFLTRVLPVADAAGTVVRWFGTNTDVEAERAAREAAELANQAKTDFLATMSHELRTPLNAIAGYAELLEMGIHGPVNAAQREALGRIQRSQRHLLGLINDVLNFAKLEAGHVEYHISNVTARDAVDTLEPLVAPQLRAKSLRFDREECAGAAVVRADPDKLQQILVNLLSNAIKFTAPGGAVTMRCRTESAVVHLEVEDTGIGIAAERLEHVFAPFVQVDRRLNTPHEGTGLGLAISRDLARGMGGDLAVESAPGVGSTFTLTLPAAR